MRVTMFARGSKQSAASAGVFGPVSLRACKLPVPYAHAYVMHASRRQTLERRLRWHAHASP
jgi:hypothetical protein